MRANRTLAISLVLALIIAVPAAAAGKRLIVGGSTSVLPLMQKLAAAYHHAYPRIPEPKVEGGQSDIGIEGVASGRFDIGDSSRDPLSTDPKNVNSCGRRSRATASAWSPTTRTPSRTSPRKRSRRSSAAPMRDWSEVEGATVSGPIDLFDRSSASGTQDAFQNIFMGQDLKISPSASTENSNGEEQNAV